MKQTLIERLQACHDLHLSCADKWCAKDDMIRFAMHLEHCATLQSAIAKLGKPKKPASVPTREEAISYGLEIHLPKREAEKFCDHFDSNGWKVGGKSAMKDWKASLRNWRRSWEERNPQEARLRKPAPAQTGDPAGWTDWLETKALPVRAFSSASGWMKEEFRQWLKEAN